jgi:hypothetical protein
MIRVTWHSYHVSLEGRERGNGEGQRTVIILDKFEGAPHLHGMIWIAARNMQHRGHILHVIMRLQQPPGYDGLSLA